MCIRVENVYSSRAHTQVVTGAGWATDRQTLSLSLSLSLSLLSLSLSHAHAHTQVVTGDGWATDITRAITDSLKKDENMSTTAGVADVLLMCC